MQRKKRLLDYKKVNRIIRIILASGDSVKKEDRMRKRLISIMMACLVGAFLLLCGCSGDNSSGTNNGDPKASTNEPQDLILVDSNYVLSDGYVEYALEIENPNTNYAPDFVTIIVTGKHADGSIAFNDEWVISTVLPGSTTYWASQAGDGDTVESDVIEIKLSVKDTDWEKTEQTLPADLYSFDNVSVTPSQFGGLSAKGEITLNDDTKIKFHDTKSPMIVCILKDADGKIVAGFNGYMNSDLNVGTPSVFDIDSFFDKVEYATAEMYANPWG